MINAAGFRYDYDKGGREILSTILDMNSNRLSRTRKGISNIGSSVSKRPLLLSGHDLRQRCRANELEVHKFLWQSRHDEPPDTGEGFRALLYKIADMVNDGLLPAGRLRTWDFPSKDQTTVRARALPPRVQASDIEPQIDKLCDQINSRREELTRNPIPVAALIEWEINAGSLHPFYDACGRISRLFSACMLIQHSCLLPLYDDAETYYENANLGLHGFSEYVVSRIAACHHWVSEIYGD